MTCAFSLQNYSEGLFKKNFHHRLIFLQASAKKCQNWIRAFQNSHFLPVCLSTRFPGDEPPLHHVPPHQSSLSSATVVTWNEGTLLERPQSVRVSLPSRAERESLSRRRCSVMTAPGHCSRRLMNIKGIVESITCSACPNTAIVAADRSRSCRRSMTW